MRLLKSSDEIAAIQSQYSRAHFLGVRQLAVYFETTEEAIRELLPPPLKPAPEPLGAVIFAEIGNSNCMGAFNGGSVYLRARYQDVTGHYCIAAPRSTVEAVTVGREIFGEPTKLARVVFETMQDEIGNLANTFNEMMSRLEKSFAQMRQFSSDASHELRTPLTVLKGQSELVLTKPRSKAEYQEVLSSNLEEINYMSRILEDLLTLSKGDEREVSLEKEPVELGNIIEEVSRQGEIFADEKDVKIILAYLEPVTILGDAHRLKQMIWILLHNAVKFTPSGGEIKITLQDLDDTVYFTIKDTGIGIPEQDLPRIFDRFYRVDKARSRIEGGSGLGLAICKYIVDRHYGIIDVESKLGEGTKFKIRFPKYVVAQRKTA